MNPPDGTVLLHLVSDDDPNLTVCGISGWQLPNMIAGEVAKMCRQCQLIAIGREVSNETED